MTTARARLAYSLLAATAATCALSTPASAAAAPTSVSSGPTPYQCSQLTQQSNGERAYGNPFSNALAVDLTTPIPDGKNVPVGAKIDLVPGSGTFTLSQAFVAHLRDTGYASGRLNLAATVLVGYDNDAHRDQDTITYLWNERQLDVRGDKAVTLKTSTKVAQVGDVTKKTWTVPALGETRFALTTLNFTYWGDNSLVGEWSCGLPGEVADTIAKITGVAAAPKPSPTPKPTKSTETPAPTAAPSPVRPVVVQTDTAQPASRSGLMLPAAGAGAAGLLALGAAFGLKRRSAARI